MRILVVSNFYPPVSLGGYELGCSQMVEALAERGHELLVVTSTSPGDAEYSGGDVLRVLQVPPIYDTGRMSLLSGSVQAEIHVRSTMVNSVNVRALLDAIERFQPDVAYLWNILGLGALGILTILARLGIPWVWHLMDSIPAQVTGFGTTEGHLARALGEVFPGRYVCCSSRTIAEIESCEVDLGDRVELVPNWVHGERPPPRRTFFHGGALRLLSASGSLHRAKGTDIVIECAALTRQRGFANFRIDLYGRHDDPRFAALVRTREVEENVRLMGPLPHERLLERYGDYDVFIFPTWSREPFAFAPLEAAASGCLPLLSDDCGNAEWMIDGVDCLKAPRSAESFSDRLGQVLSGEIDLAPIARRAQAGVWRDFHVSGAAAVVERVLDEASRERRRPTAGRVELLRLADYAEGLVPVLLEEAAKAPGSPVAKMVP